LLSTLETPFPPHRRFLDCLTCRRPPSPPPPQFLFPPLITAWLKFSSHSLTLYHHVGQSGIFSFSAFFSDAHSSLICSLNRVNHMPFGFWQRTQPSFFVCNGDLLEDHFFALEPVPHDFPWFDSLNPYDVQFGKSLLRVTFFLLF